MAKRWLSIIVDGNSAMSPIWPKIVSEYLETIVRSFFCNSRNEGVSSCEIGLVMYNTNSDIGLNVHFINWTKDVDHFISNLRTLTFNGNADNQHTVVEGLVQGLLMFPRNRMTAEEYVLCERHCILVATGDPVPSKVVVPLPAIKDSNFVEGELIPLPADFLDVAKIFGMVNITLSVIMPKNHRVFTEIFNLGNPLTAKSPLIDHGNGEFTVFLSRKFMEALYVMNTATDVTLPMNATQDHQENQFSAGSSMAIEQQSIQGFQNVRIDLGQEFVNPLAQVVPQGTAANDMHVAPSNFSQPTNALDELALDDLALDELLAEANTVVDALKPFFKGNSWKDILLEFLDLHSDGSLEENQTLPLTTEVEGQSTQAMLQDLTRDVTPSIELITTPNAFIHTFGQGPSQALGHQELGGNVGVVNPILSSNPNSTFPLPQNNPYSWTAGSSGVNITSVGLGIGDPQGAGIFDDIATGNTLAQLQSSSSPSFPVIPHNNSSGYQDVRVFHRFEMNGVSSLVQPAEIMRPNIWVYPQHNEHRYFHRPPSLADFPDFVDAWQGYLVGKVDYSHRESVYLAKALRKSTSPITLTGDWSSMLQIIIFIPRTAVNYTTRICGAPIDYMFFHIIQCENLYMLDHMKSNNLCAKVQLPSQTLILTATDSKHHLLGTIFPMDTVFVEPLQVN